MYAKAEKMSSSAAAHPPVPVRPKWYGCIGAGERWFIAASALPVVIGVTPSLMNWLGAAQIVLAMAAAVVGLASDEYDNAGALLSFHLVSHAYFALVHAHLTH